MDIRKLQRAIVDGLEDVKAQHIAVFNTEHLSSMFERVIIASGTSNRQTKALAASVRDAVKGRGMQVMSTEGEDNGEWIIVDCGAAVAHIMQPAIREYYHLEEIWGGKSVRLKLGEVNTKLVKASEPEPEAKAEPARKAAKAKPPRPPMKKPALHTAAGKTAAKKATNKSAAYKRVGAKRPAAKTEARTAAAKKAPTRRAPRPA
jgi:ribosome-associated protein